MLLSLSLSQEHWRLRLLSLKAIGRNDTELTQQVERLEQYWRSVLWRLVSVIKNIAERDLAFRGDNKT